MPYTQETDFIVAGAGVAGLRAAIELAEAGRVLLLAKQEWSESATEYAQGGVAVALSDEDEIGLHLKDTIAAGDGLVNEAAAQVLVEEGPQRIQELLDWGTAFDREGSRLAFTREAAHSRSRILHAHGDSTGREMGRALAAKARTLPNIRFGEFGFTADLAVAGGRVCGVHLLAAPGKAQYIAARAVLLATGGAGQVFRVTTNPGVATGDGVAMAFRAGADISDMEFMQFHPTALALEGAPHFLLSEALRGEGAQLKNAREERFMPRYHAMAELAPRDVVARAIWKEMAEGPVYLDLRQLDARHVAARFPRIHATCLGFGIDITRQPVPVSPAAHYLMGGVKTDLAGRTTLPGLYAAGESACTGVHGANRLASNSLLEGLVFGARAGQAMREEIGKGSTGAAAGAGKVIAGGIGPLPAQVAREKVRTLMWQECGVVRSGAGLKRARRELEAISLPAPVDREWCEAANLLQAATLMVRAALAREESRGAHFRTDFPERNDATFRKHSVISRNDSGVRFV